VYFGMSVSAPYLEATVTTAAAARQRGDLEVFVNISKMTVSQMSLTQATDSPQQRQRGTTTVKGSKSSIVIGSIPSVKGPPVLSSIQPSPRPERVGNALTLAAGNGPDDEIAFRPRLE
jgi:hypothetical protein